MATTEEKLQYLNSTKGLIKVALNNLGAELTEEDTFRSYATKINDLYNEYQNIQNS